MKFVKLLILQIFLTNILLAQKGLKNEDVKTEYTILSYKLYAKNPLLKTQYYKEIFPTKLNNNVSKGINIKAGPYLNLDAKLAKAKDAPSVTFKYNTIGITELNDEGNYSYEKYLNATKQVFVNKRINYKCPYSIEILDSLDKLKQTIIISSTEREFHYQIDRTFLVPPPALGQPAIVAQGFSSEAEADTFFVKNRAQIAAKIELICLNEITEEAKRAIYSIYDFSKYPKTVFYYFELENKSKEKFPEMFARTEKFKETLKNYDEPALKAAATNTLSENYTFFKEKINDKNLPDDVRQLCRYNTALSALFINKIEDAKFYYKEFYERFYLQVPVGVYLLPGAFSDLYKFHYIYSEIQSNLEKNIIELNPSLDELYYQRFLADNNLKDKKIEEVKKLANPESFVYDEQKNKKLILDLWSFHESLNTGANVGFREPAEYIYKEGTKEIMGQKFLDAPGYKKYVYLLLQNTTGNTPKASYGGTEMNLVWEYNRLKSMTSKNNSDFDFTVDYDKENKMIGISANKLINGYIQTVCRPEFENGKLTKTTKFENEKGRSPWTRAIKTIAYSDTAIVVECLTYFTGKPNTLKNSSTQKGTYKNNNGKSFITVQPYYNQIDETFYNESEDIVKKISTNQFKITEETFFYDSEKRNYKRETINRKLDRSYIHKDVVIESIPANQSPNVPSFEKVIGGYKLTEAGELIYEAIGGRYRNKVNGIWEDWKNFRM